MREAGRTLDVAIDCSLNVIPAYKLSNDRTYPKAGRDFERTFDLVKKLPCDISYAHMRAHLR